MTAKKRKKIFDVDRKINRPVILEQKGGSKREAEMRVLARKIDLEKTPEGKKFVSSILPILRRKYIKVQGNKILVKNQYLPTGNISLTLSPVDEKTKMMRISWFYPKHGLKFWGHNIKREGIGEAAAKRVIEIANAITKKGEKMIIKCDTQRGNLQELLNKLGFKELENKRPGVGGYQKYKLVIDKTKKKVKK